MDIFCGWTKNRKMEFEHLIDNEFALQHML